MKYLEAAQEERILTDLTENAKSGKYVCDERTNERVGDRTLVWKNFARLITSWNTRERGKEGTNGCTKEKKGKKGRKCMNERRIVKMLAQSDDHLTICDPRLVVAMQARRVIRTKIDIKLLTLCNAVL